MIEEIEIIQENCDKLLEMFSENLTDDSNMIEKYKNNPPKDEKGYNSLFDDLEGNILFSETLLSEVDEIIQKLEQLKELATMRIELDTTVGSNLNKKKGLREPSLQTYSEDSVRQNVDISQLPEEQQEFVENLLELQSHREKKGGKSKKKYVIKKVKKQLSKKNFHSKKPI
jgi:ABC-type ATPase with predicted acetyltransferase domain